MAKREDPLPGAPGANLDGPIASAAWYRVGLGQTWAEVGERVHRKAETVRAWQYEFPARWEYHARTAREAVEEDKTAAKAGVFLDVLMQAPDAVRLVTACIQGYAPETPVDPQVVICPHCDTELIVEQVTVTVAFRDRLTAAKAMMDWFWRLCGDLDAVDVADALEALRDLPDEELITEGQAMLRAIEGGLASPPGA